MRIQANPSTASQLFAPRQSKDTRKGDASVALQASSTEIPSTDKRKTTIKPVDQKLIIEKPNRTGKPAVTTTIERPTVQPNPKPRVPGSGETSTKSSLTTAGDSNRREPLTLDGLLKAWGQKDSPYDLTGNGTVDVDDLLAFINSMPVPQPPSTASTPPIIEPPASTDAAPVSDSLSTVDGHAVTPQSPDKPVGKTENTFSTAPSGSGNALQPHPPLTFEGLLGAWGQSGSEYDLNGDGTVNVDDLLAFINSQPAPPINVEKPNGLPAPVDFKVAESKEPVNSISTNGNASPPPNSSLAANNDSNASPSLSTAGNEEKSSLNSVRGLQQFITSLMSRLDAAGFSDQPPANIQDVVSKLDLSAKQQQQVFTQLAAKYPRGLGVNVIG